MGKQYFYGAPDQETYNDQDIYEAAINLRDYYSEEEEIEMVEMRISSKSGERFCTDYHLFTDGNPCGKWCDGYNPRNKKNGICKYLSWGLIETGRKWGILKDGTLKKVSGRKR